MVKVWLFLGAAVGELRNARILPNFPFMLAMADGKDFSAATKKLQTTMNSLEPGAFFRVLREQQKAGLLNNETYKEAINYQIDTMIAIRTNTKKNGQWNDIGKPQFEQGVAELMESLKGFTPEEIKAIRDRLKAKK